jgi:hypothetical protein
MQEGRVTGDEGREVWMMGFITKREIKHLAGALSGVRRGLQG